MTNRIIVDIERIIATRESGTAPTDVLEYIKKQADSYLREKPISVTERKLKAPSGDPKDYASMGIYWWPNPATPDHLPYVRRDGEVNPEVVDDVNIENLAKRIRILTLAEVFFGTGAYARAAEDQIYTWFIDEKLAMNPHGEYAQGIPGICEGRGIGLIEYRTNIDIMDSVRILEAIGKISAEVSSGIRDWFVKLTDWMLTSEKGIDEDNQHNNHGAWYDAQIMAMAIFTKRENLAKRIMRTSYGERQLKHIMPDGSQPHELARTRAMHYSLFNSKALILIATMAKSLGDDRYASDGLLKLSVEYIRKYYTAPETFPYREIHLSSVKSVLSECLVLLDNLYPGEGYSDAADQFCEGYMYFRII
jgi:hypothetical protein